MKLKLGIYLFRIVHVCVCVYVFFFLKVYQSTHQINQKVFLTLALFEK